METSVQASIEKAYTNAKTYFTKDAQLLYMYLEDGEKTEDIERFINRVVYDKETAERDVRNYRELVKEQIKDADIFLCGHIHADGKLVEINTNTEQEDRVCIIRKFADADKIKIAPPEIKPYVRVLRPRWESNGIKIEISQY